jgi:hypothetical protein
MERDIKTKGLLDVRVVFNAKLSKSIREDLKNVHRTAIEQVRFIVDQYYQARD